MVMACYNGELFIKDQLDSLRMQTRKIEECLFIDDNSQDNTADLIEAYIRQYHCNGWKLFRNHVNTGYVRAFEKGMAYAHGDIVFLADQDDIWNWNKIEKMSMIMQKNPEIQSLCSSFSCIDGKGRKIPFRSAFLTENHGLILLRKMQRDGLYRLKFDDIVQRNVAMGCTMAVRNRLIREYLKHVESENMPHDWKLNFLAALHGGLYFQNTEWISYRIHSHNTIGMRTDKRQIDCEYRIQEYQKYISSYMEMERLLSFSDISCPKKKSHLKKILKTEELYRRRVSALQNRNIGQMIALMIKYIPWLGIRSLLTCMDIKCLSKYAG